MKKLDCVGVGEPMDVEARIVNPSLMPLYIDDLQVRINGFIMEAQPYKPSLGTTFFLVCCCVKPGFYEYNWYVHLVLLFFIIPPNNVRTHYIYFLILY